MQMRHIFRIQWNAGSCTSRAWPVTSKPLPLQTGRCCLPKTRVLDYVWPANGSHPSDAIAPESLQLLEPEVKCL